MTLYRTTFERLNFGINPPLKQTADVIFETDIPFEDDSLEAFEKVVWAAMWAQNPHWKDPSAPAGMTTGWSSVMGGRRIEVIPEETLESLAWYIPERAWLKADGVTTTVDPEEAGRFSNRQMLELQAKYPGERYPMVMGNRVEDLYRSRGDGYKLEIRRDEFVFWGYGEEGRQSPRLAIANKYISLGDVRIPVPFSLPDSVIAGGRAMEYERRIVWAWRFDIHGYDWKVEATPEDAVNAARERAIDYMRQNGSHDIGLYLATKHRVEIVDGLDPKASDASVF